MRSDSSAFQQYTAGLSKRPRYVAQICFETTFTDSSPADSRYAYFTSHSDADYPSGGVVYHSTIAGISGTTQRIDPLRGNATIGEINVTLNDTDDDITTLFGTKLAASKGLRGKRVRVYKGSDGMAWADYALIATQIVKNVKWKKSGAYLIQCADIQRSTRKDIFITATTTLTATIPGPEDSTYAATGATINVADTSSFQTWAHGTSYTDGTASTTCAYFEIEDEVMMYTGKTATTFTGVSRGWLGTRPARHEIDASASTARKTLVEEYVYLEMPSLKMAYALLTGTGIPTSWHLGISTDYIDDAAFTTAHPDLYNSSNDLLGFPLRFVGEKRQDGKAFIEQQIMMPIAGFMPVLSTGELSFRRMTRILSNAGYVARFDASNVVDFGELEHRLEDCINTVAIDWNYDHISGKNTRRTSLTDANSITAHGASPPKLLVYRGLYGNKHTDASIAQAFDAFIDRYSRPPELINISTLHTQNAVEVGDIVRVQLDEVRDMTGDVATSVTLNRSFEVQQVHIDWITGETSFDLFGSSGAGTAIARTTNATDLNDSFYTTGLAANREINATNCGAAYSAGVLTSFAFTGHADATDSSAIWWHNGDLTIAGACTWTNNIQLRVKGTRTLTGSLTSVGGGHAGGAAASAGGSGMFSARGQGGFDRVDSRNICEERSIFVAGTRNALPAFSLLNDAGVLSGLPTDLRGTGGPGGQHVFDPDGDIEASGAAGGAGGGGLIEIARAFVAGVNAHIDTSGLQGSVSTNYYGVSGCRFYAGSGGSGAPGAWLAILDGNSVNAPDASILTANRPASALAATAEIGKQCAGMFVLPNNSYSCSYGRNSLESYSDDEPIGSSAFRFMRVPQNITPATDVPLTTSIPTGLSVVEATNTPQTPAENLATLTVTVTPPSDGNYSHSNIYYRVSGSGKPYTPAGPADDAYTIVAAMDGTAYEVIAKPVSIFGVESDESRRATITMSNAKGGVNLATGNWVASGQTAYDTGVGFYMVNEGGTPKFSIGNSAGNKMTWNGTTLAIVGTITASLGAIGGWSIGATALTAGSGANTVGLDSGGSNPAIYAGSATPGSAPFRVTQAGALTATNATITGTITATAGDIGSWNINGNTLQSDSGGLVLDAANNRARFTNGLNYVEVGPSGIRGVDNVLGTTVQIPIDGTAPTFSSGIINSTIYNVSTSGILRTSSTVGDGTAAGEGVLINDTGIKCFEESNATPTVHINATDGSITAKKGTIGGATITTTELKNGTNMVLDWSNKKFSINDATWGSSNPKIIADFNSGTPRCYIGNGVSKSFEFDGTDVKLGRDTKFSGADAYNNTSLYERDTWRSIDGYYKSGTPPTLNADGTLTFEPTNGQPPIILYKDKIGYLVTPTHTTSRFIIRIKSVNWGTGGFLKFGLGTMNDPPAVTDVTKEIGFYVDNTSTFDLFGYCGNDTARTNINLSTTLTGSVWYTLEFRYTVSSNVEFFVNGVSKGTITTNLPSGGYTGSAFYGMSSVSTSAASKKTIFGELRVQID